MKKTCLLLFFCFFEFFGEGQANSQTNSAHMKSTSTDVGAKKSSKTSRFDYKSTYNVDGHTGGFNYAIHLPVYKGRNGMTPIAGIFYNSQARVGFPARGWSVPMTCILRSTKKGRPSYSPVGSVNSDTFIFSSPGLNLELVNVPTEGTSTYEYRAKNESLFYRYVYKESSNSWTVFKKNGASITLGGTANSRELNSLGVFRWCVNKESDKNGNVIDYEYIFYLNKLYLHEVFYGGHESSYGMKTLFHFYKIRYDMVNNLGNTYVDYRSGERVVKNGKKLNSISFLVKIPNTLSFKERRRLKITYSSLSLVSGIQNSSGDAVISEVQEEAISQDGINTITKPAVKFSYYGNALNYLTPEKIIFNGSESFNYTNLISQKLTRTYIHNDDKYVLRDFLDMNGDGLLDYVQADGIVPHPISVSEPNSIWPPVNAITWKVRFQKSNGSFQVAVDWPFTGSTNYEKCSSCSKSIRKTYAPYAAPGESTVTENMIDFDGDGRPDYVTWSRWCRNNGAGFDPCVSYVTTPQIPQSYSSSPLASHLSKHLNFGVYSVQNRHLTDFNGDGLPDKIYALQSSTSRDILVFKGTLTGYEISPLIFPATNPCTTGLLTNTLICGESISLSSSKNPLSSGPSAPVSFFTASNMYTDMLDFNGDGLPDRLVRDSTGSVTIRYNNGKSFVSLSENIGNFSTSSEIGIGLGNSAKHRRVAQIVDVDGDGQLDFVRKLAEPNGPYDKLRVQFGKGIGGISPTVIDWQVHNGTVKLRDTEYTDYTQSPPLVGDMSHNESSQYLFKDLDGDGRPDFIFREKNSEGFWEWKVVKGVYSPTFKMKKIDFSNGFKIEIVYKKSTHYNSDAQNSQSVPPAQIPFPFDVVSSIKTIDDKSGSSTPVTGVTTYQYSDPKYDGVNRDSRGFGTVVITNPKNLQTTRVFAQGEYSQGLLLSETVKDMGKQSYFRKVTYQIGSKTIYNTTPKVMYFYTEMQTTEIAEHQAQNSVVVSNVFYEYDNNGNLIRKKHQSSYPFCVEYVYKSINHPLQYTGQSDIYNFALAKVTEYDNALCNGSVSGITKFYHDYNHSDLMYISKGNLTRTEICEDASCQNVVANEKKYDNCSSISCPFDKGLLTKSIDANGNEKKIVFDSNFYLYVSEIENSMGHKVTFGYDYGLGVATTSSGPNPNQESLTEYDLFGRKISSSVKVFDSNASNYTFKTAKTWSYDDANMSFEERIYRVFGDVSSGIIVNRIYFNGSGKPIQKRSTYSNVSGGTSFSVTDLQYNNVDELIRVSKGYLSSSSGYTHHLTGNLGTSFEYDGLGRLIKKVHPDGSLSKIEYFPLWKRMTDENGKHKDVFYNVLGKISSVKEYNQGSTYITTYTYDRWGRLIATLDTEGHYVSFEYDWLDRLIRRISVNHQSSSSSSTDQYDYFYDKNGNLVRTLDNRGIEIELIYDSLNRLIKKDIYLSLLMVRINRIFFTTMMIPIYPILLVK